MAVKQVVVSDISGVELADDGPCPRHRPAPGHPRPGGARHQHGRGCAAHRHHAAARGDDRAGAELAAAHRADRDQGARPAVQRRRLRPRPRGGAPRRPGVGATVAATGADRAGVERRRPRREDRLHRAGPLRPAAPWPRHRARRPSSSATTATGRAPTASRRGTRRSTSPTPPSRSATRSEPGPAVTALFVFDMDGTLLPGSSASLEIARALGALDDLHALEARFSVGGLDTRGFAAAVHDLFGGLERGPGRAPCSRPRASWRASSTCSPTSVRAANGRS